jgi:hypothetical protein
MDLKDSLTTILNKWNENHYGYKHYSKKIKELLSQLDNATLKYILEDLIEKDWTDQEKHKYFGDDYRSLHLVNEKTTKGSYLDLTSYSRPDKKTIDIYIKPTKTISLDDIHKLNGLEKTDLTTAASLFINERTMSSRNINDCIIEANSYIIKHIENSKISFGSEDSDIEKRITDLYLKSLVKNWKFNLTEEEKTEISSVANILIDNEKEPKWLSIKITL